MNKLKLRILGQTSRSGPFRVKTGVNSCQFLDLCPRYIRKCVVRVPRWHMELGRIVPDAVIGRWNGKTVDFDEIQNPLRHSGDLRANDCIVVCVESPHKDEFEKRTNEISRPKPLRPLQGNTARLGMSLYLGEIIAAAIKEMSKNGVPLPRPGAKIVVANPVQHQASLHHLLPFPSGKRQKGADKLRVMLRDEVWRAVFNCDEVQRDFSSRLYDYRPSLILLAPTKGVLPDLIRFLESTSWAWINVSAHPCQWSRVKPTLLGEASWRVRKT